MLALLASVLMMIAPKLSEHKFQELFRTSAYHHRISAFIGGLQAGKTIAGADTVHFLIYGKKLTVPEQVFNFVPEVWFLSKSYTLAEAMWDTFQARHPECIIPAEECRKMGLKLVGNVHWLYPNVPNGKPIRVRVRTAADPENLRATPNVIIAWADEIAHWKETAWLNLLGRGIVTPTKFLLTTTPKGKNWLYREVYKPGTTGSEDDKKEILVVRCRSIDNPWATATEAGRRYMEKLRKTFGKEYADQELDAMFTDQIGYVYADFDRDIHMQTPPSMDPSFYKDVIVGADPGTRDPYAVGVWARTYEGVWWKLREFYKTGGSTSRWLPEFKKIQETFKARAWFVDKRRPSDILDLQDGGLPAQANIDIHAEDDRRTIPPMVAICRELLRNGKLFINTDCDYTAEEFENYHYPDEVDEREKNTNDQPVDWMNHAMDEMRYGICSVEDITGETGWKRDDKNPNKHVSLVKLSGKPKPFTAPTIEQTLAAQDAKWAEMEQARNG